MSVGELWVPLVESAAKPQPRQTWVNKTHIHTVFTFQSNFRQGLSIHESSTKFCEGLDTGIVAGSMVTHLTALWPGLPRWASTSKLKPIWILLKQETVSGSGINWAICKSAPHSKQITMPAPHHSVFYRPDAFPAANQQCQSTEGMMTHKCDTKHWSLNVYQRRILLNNEPVFRTGCTRLDSLNPQQQPPTENYSMFYYNNAIQDGIQKIVAAVFLLHGKNANRIVWW